MSNRIHIDAPAGTVEIEGEKDFVEQMLAKLFPLIEATKFGSHPQSSENAEPDAAAAAVTGGVPEKEHPEVSKKRGRKPVRQPPAGQSCPARIQVLKDEGFFKEHRAGADIVAGLNAKGWTHNLNQVGAATSALFNKGILQRTKEGNGPWLYYWDRG